MKTQMNAVNCRKVLLLVCAGIWFGWIYVGAADPIPKDFDKNLVAFTFHSDPNGEPTVPSGTCFFVIVRSTNNPNQAFMYMVTAKHVIQDQTTNHNYLPQALVRFRQREKSDQPMFTYFPLKATNGNSLVLTNSDPDVDLAVVPVSSNIVSTALIKGMDSDILARDFHIKKFNIREGDDMFFMGLFSIFYGAKINVPLLRFGRLAMLSDERIPIGNGKSQNYYLMETFAFPGNSGSPAFFYFSQQRNPGDASFLLAGVVSAYYPQWTDIKLRNTSVAPVSSENTGIAIITPAYLLHEILYSTDAERIRAEK